MGLAVWGKHRLSQSLLRHKNKVVMEKETQNNTQWLWVKIICSVIKAAALCFHCVPSAVKDHCQSSATSSELKTDCKIHIHDIYILSWSVQGITAGDKSLLEDKPLIQNQKLIRTKDWNQCLAASAQQSSSYCRAVARASITEYYDVTVRLTFDYLHIRHHHLIFYPIKRV